MVSSFFSRFRRPKTKLNLEISGAPFYPGSTVSVQVSLATEDSIDVRGALLEVLCTQDVHGRDENDFMVVHHQIPVRQSKTFLTDEQVIPGVPYLTDLSFDLPTDAQLTVKGELAKINWQVNVTVDIVDRPDLHKSLGMTVLSSPQGETPSAVERVHSQISDYGDNRNPLSLSVPVPQSPIGGVVSGILRAQSSEDMTVWFVRVTLNLREEAGRENETKEVQRITLARELSLSTGETLEWPFSLNIPMKLIPSISFGETDVRWYVSGSASRRVMGDWTVEQEIQVYSVS